MCTHTSYLIYLGFPIPPESDAIVSQAPFEVLGKEITVNFIRYFLVQIKASVNSYTINKIISNKIFGKSHATCKIQ